ncbi:MAG: hypothetical protein A2452_11140 [Candidatus Firestonebacteria bacterium RIFOXYC2_FULL_39_67]|nr:MAG: hypothetical protein A2452_11140 [Candidatus Firestonebacteria bacterium RIFOXYC2_FULL_39_67]
MTNSNSNSWENEFDDILKHLYDFRGKFSSLKVQLEVMAKKEIIICSKILKKQRFNAQVYLRRAKCKRLTHHFYGAIKDCTKAIELNDAYLPAYGERSFCYLLIRDYEKAIFDYSKILEKYKTDKYFYFRGICRARLKIYAQAIEDFTEALKLHDAEWPSVVFKRGFCYLKSKKYDEAILDLLEVVRLDNKNTKYLHNLGIAYKLKGKIKLAKEVFDLKRELMPLSEMNEKEPEDSL